MGQMLHYGMGHGMPMAWVGRPSLSRLAAWSLAHCAALLRTSMHTACMHASHGARGTASMPLGTHTGRDPNGMHRQATRTAVERPSTHTTMQPELKAA